MKTIKIFSFFFIFLITVQVHGYFVANESCGAFLPNTCDNKSYRLNSTAVSLGQLIVEGGSYYLQSNGDYQLFLKNLELYAITGANNDELLKIITGAIESMELANDTYGQMVKISESLEYNPEVLEKLKGFDYYSYMAGSGLNPVVFRQVESFLRPGDVRGCYRYIYKATKDILYRLNEIKAEVESGVFPGLKSCWRLNQVYLETELFGQYVAEVFEAIK